jgi:hypothetical protein
MDNIQDIAAAPSKATSPDTYFKVQIRFWTKFDPRNAELIELARAVEEGTALVSAMEVTRVASEVNEIDDPDVREQFENVAAAERILHNVEHLSSAVREKLRAALTNAAGSERLAS